MNFSQYTSDFTAHVYQVSPWSIPGTLWNYYMEYLWFYESNSWVATIAYACRILAIFIALPLVILGLLDISSYAIARTLGVIDDVKASTSDKATVHDTTTPPSILVQGISTPSSDSTFSDSDRDSFTDHNAHNVARSPLSDSFYSESHQPVFYAGDEHNLKLSGVGVFSPAASQPPSPTISREKINFDSTTGGKEHVRHRAHQQVEDDN